MLGMLTEMKINLNTFYLVSVCAIYLLPVWAGKLIDQRPANPPSVSSLRPCDTAGAWGIYQGRDALWPPLLTAGPETGRGQEVTTETHSHLKALLHRGRQATARVSESLCSAEQRPDEEADSNRITADIKFVGCLDSEVCALENLI